ncbi:MAG TPA: hypothetical protein VK762_13985 [Polyangiaceae bacterium]|jgi:hypothetical protein|nr:hypothetical protein [Polyangiaceae bacterium]
MWRRLPSILALLAAPCGAGCTWNTALPADAAAIPVDRGRELVVTDDATLLSLSNNAADDPLSFRHAMERLPTSSAPAAATLAWLRGWSQRLREEGESARADSLDADVTCPWLRQSPENGCSTSCDVCASESLRLDLAPFRLVAVANRTDLSVMPDRAADGGEGRLVFALTGGPADAQGARTLPFTVIVEYAQVGSASDWANRWHALGAVTHDAFPGQLAKLTGAFAESGTLAQVRTGDAVTGPLLLHEFHLVSGELVATDVRNTPDWSAVSESEVRAFCVDNASALANGTHVLPGPWLARSSALHATPPSYVATLPSGDALLQGTCGGCHDQTDLGFQIDPLATGDGKLSRFLVDPSKSLDEIGRRTEWMQLTLSQCHDCS